jgi:hypothetical protein
MLTAWRCVGCRIGTKRGLDLRQAVWYTECEDTVRLLWDACSVADREPFMQIVTGWHGIAGGEYGKP